MNKRLALLVLGAASATFGVAALAAPSRAPQVTLNLHGTHPIDKETHEGTFTAQSPLCTSGTWAGNGQGTRIFTCADGSGTFSANFQGELEHTTGSVGPWAITAGTGSYLTLRGKGTATVNSSVPGPPITFDDTWRGIAAFDDTAPSGAVTAVKITRPPVKHRRWKLRLTFSARDNDPTDPVSFSANADAGLWTAKRRGTVTASPRTLAFAFRRGRGVRVFHIEITLDDPVGNEGTLKRNVRLP
jgi:hypothetical protein